MLPAADDNGARLAAILPSGLAAIAPTVGADPIEVLSRAVRFTTGGEGGVSLDVEAVRPQLPVLRSFVIVVVDGLGEANLKARAGHARTLASLQRRRISTVIPSTTAAALTTLVTGSLPGTHGLIGYRIRHPELGILSPLKDWEGIRDPRTWQRATPIFEHANDMGVRALAIGRPAHAVGGLTEAILRGTEYVGGQRIEDRFDLALTRLSDGMPSLVYLYIDELDKAGHESGWEGEAWLRRLEQFDAALDSFLGRLPSDIGVVVTADHGMVDVTPEQHVLLDEQAWFGEHVQDVGGEPRMRSLYLRDGSDAQRVAQLVQHTEDLRAWVGTREDAIQANWYGSIDDEVADRVGDVIIAARKQVAYYLSDDSPASRAMVGQHGSLSSEERGVPLALAGACHASGFAAAVARVAALLA